MEVIIDCSLFSDKSSAHHYLKEQLAFPDHYGSNLDALYDCLMELSGCRLLLRSTDSLRQLGAYGDSLLDTLRDAAADNPGLELAFL